MALAVAAATWPLAGSAQKTPPHHVGVLVLGNPDPAPFLKALKDGLLERGYVEGQNIFLEVRSAEGRASALADLAAELVRLKVSVIVAYQTSPAQAAKEATTEIPIVMAGVGDPVGTRLVTSLARPGGNVTGTSSAAAEIAGKDVEALHEMLPLARRIGVFANASSPFATPFLAQIETAAKTAGLEVQPIMLRPDEAFDPAFDEMRRRKIDAVILQGSLMRKEAADLALKYRLPLVGNDLNRLDPSIGALLAYTANFELLFRETTTYVDKILKGAKPADLPVQLPTKYDLVINLKTAKALGITVPPTLLIAADEVIE